MIIMGDKEDRYSEVYLEAFTSGVSKVYSMTYNFLSIDV